MSFLLMNQGLILNYEYIAAHINDFINNGTVGNIFETRDIKLALKSAILTPDDFENLLKQINNTNSTKELYSCTRNASIYINNFQDIISTLRAVENFMKLRFLDIIIDFLNQTEKSKFQ